MEGNLNMKQAMGLIWYNSFLSGAQIRTAGLGAALIDYVVQKTLLACSGPKG